MSLKNYLKLKHKKVDALVHVTADGEFLFIFPSPRHSLCLTLFPRELFAKAAGKATL